MIGNGWVDPVSQVWWTSCAYVAFLRHGEISLHVPVGPMRLSSMSSHHATSSRHRAAAPPCLSRLRPRRKYRSTQRAFSPHSPAPKGPSTSQAREGSILPLSPGVPVPASFQGGMPAVSAAHADPRAQLVCGSSPFTPCRVSLPPTVCPHLRMFLLIVRRERLCVRHGVDRLGAKARPEEEGGALPGIH